MDENTANKNWIEAAKVHGNHKHGGVGTKLYAKWAGMRSRCLLKSNTRYADYGGRGIKICDEWNDFLVFKAWAMDNGYKEGLTIERIDVNGNYEPINCTWIPMSEQVKNTRTNKRITYNGKTMILSDWAKEIGMKIATLSARLNKGWSVEKSIIYPVTANGK